MFRRAMPESVEGRSESIILPMNECPKLERKNCLSNGRKWVIAPVWVEADVVGPLAKPNSWSLTQSHCGSRQASPWHVPLQSCSCRLRLVAVRSSNEHGRFAGPAVLPRALEAGIPDEAALNEIVSSKRGRIKRLPTQSIVMPCVGSSARERSSWTGQPLC